MIIKFKNVSFYIGYLALYHLFALSKFNNYINSFQDVIIYMIFSVVLAITFLPVLQLNITHIPRRK